MFFFFRKAELLFSKSNGFNEETHIAGKYTKCLHSFCILSSLARSTTVNVIPVLACCHYHSADCKEFIQDVKGSCCTATTGTYNFQPEELKTANDKMIASEKKVGKRTAEEIAAEKAAAELKEMHNMENI